MKKIIQYLVFLVLCPLLSPAADTPAAPVVLDIGHQQTAKEAQSPDKKINEFDF